MDPDSCNIDFISNSSRLVAKSIGVDPVHFGIIMVANLAIGFITPPLGMALFVAARVSNSKLEVVLKGILPFILVMITTLMMITFIPYICNASAKSIKVI